MTLNRLLIIAIAVAGLQACTGALAGGTVGSLAPQTPLPVLTDGNSITIQLDPARGGAITYINILDGSAAAASGNIVDNGDRTGRQVQVALYDGAWGPDFWPCPGGTKAQWGYDPVQAGNACQAVSGGSIVAQSLTAITTTTAPLQWNASSGRSKLTLEQTLTIAAPGVLRLEYTVTNHEGFLVGSANWQEMPGAYFDARFATGWYVDPAGVVSAFRQTHPGTNDLRPLTTGEPWIALTRDDGYAVALVLSGHLTPWAMQLGGGGDTPASFLDALQWLDLQPNQTRTTTAWIVVGRSLDEVRTRIATLEVSQ